MKKKTKKLTRSRKSFKKASQQGFLLGILILLALCGLVVYYFVSRSPAKVPEAATRDVYKWPFASNSIWNLPIGASAQYVSAQLREACAWNCEMTKDDEYIGLNPNDPLKSLGGDRVHVPADYSHDGSWNGIAAFLREDKRCVRQGQPLRLTRGGDPSWQYNYQTVDIYGGGNDLANCGSGSGTDQEGAHGGSVLSGIGGSIRKGELSSSEPIRHALKINLDSVQYISGAADGFRWPARRPDANWKNAGACDSYTGKVPQLEMGALLALPPSVNVDSIASSAQARKIGHALQDYGGYVVDSTCWNVHALSVEEGAEFGDGGSFHQDLQNLFKQLHVVNNWDKATYDRVKNSNGAEGAGGGAPRVSWAPPIGGAISSPVPSPIPSPSPVVQNPPASGTHNVSDLPWQEAQNGWGPVEKDRSNGEQAGGDGRTITINGTTYSKGLGGHAVSDVRVYLGKNCSIFTADAGIDDEISNSAASVVFEVWADGTKIINSPVMKQDMAAMRFSVNVAGKDQLRLVITDAGDGVGYDHGDWADPKLYCGSATPPGPTPTPVPTTPPATGVFNGEYFDNINFTGNKLTRQDSVIKFDWGSGSPISGISNDTFSVRWTGTFNFDAASYRFNATVDDGVRVYVDGQLLIDAWRDQAPTTYNALKNMASGQHQVVVEFYDNGYAASAFVNFVKAASCFDVTGDGIINTSDLNAISNHFGERGNNLPWDLNGDRRINSSDIQRAASRNGQTCS